MTEDNTTCYCDHPYRIGEKLWLCGSDLCTQVRHMMVDKMKTVNGYDSSNKTIILSEDTE